MKYKTKLSIFTFQDTPNLFTIYQKHSCDVGERFKKFAFIIDNVFFMEKVYDKYLIKGFISFDLNRASL